MEKQCHRCGRAIDESAIFCPACQAPQIRVPTPLGAEEPLATRPSVSLPEQRYESAAIPATGQIQWKKFLSTAWPLGIIAGLITGFLPPVGVLLLLPLSVVIAIRMYRRQHFGALRPGQGARLGVAMGLISFCGFAPVFASLITFNASFHQELLDGMAQAAARNPDPQARQIMEAMINSPQGFAILVAFSLIFFLLIILAFTASAGAIATAASTSKAQ